MSTINVSDFVSKMFVNAADIGFSHVGNIQLAQGNVVGGLIRHAIGLCVNASYGYFYENSVMPSSDYLIVKGLGMGMGAGAGYLNRMSSSAVNLVEKDIQVFREQEQSNLTAQALNEKLSANVNGQQTGFNPNIRHEVSNFKVGVDKMNLLKTDPTFKAFESEKLVLNEDLLATSQLRQDIDLLHSENNYRNYTNGHQPSEGMLSAAERLMGKSKPQSAKMSSWLGKAHTAGITQQTRLQNALAKPSESLLQQVQSLYDSTVGKANQYVKSCLTTQTEDINQKINEQHETVDNLQKQITEHNTNAGEQITKYGAQIVDQANAHINTLTGDMNNANAKLAKFQDFTLSLVKNVAYGTSSVHAVQMGLEEGYMGQTFSVVKGMSYTVWGGLTKFKNMVVSCISGCYWDNDGVTPQDRSLIGSAMQSTAIITTQVALFGATGLTTAAIFEDAYQSYIDSETLEDTMKSVGKAFLGGVVGSTGILTACLLEGLKA